MTWEARGVYVKFWGIVSFQEDEDANNALYSDSRFEDIDYYIWDMTDVDQFEIKDDEIDFPVITDKVAASYKPILKGALVATDKTIQRIFEIFINKSVEAKSTWKLKQFEQVSEARSWTSLR